MAPLRALLRLLSLRHFARTRGRTALTVLGVAIGVAALVAIDLVNVSSTATIDELAAAYGGRASLSVRAPGGTLAPEALAAVARLEGARHVAGSIQGALLVAPHGGVPSADARSALPFVAGIGDEREVRDYAFASGAAPRGGEIALGIEAARRLAVERGDVVNVFAPAGPRTLTLSGVLAERGLGRANAGYVAVLDFATADDLYRRGGRLDAIDVVVAPGAREADVVARIREAIPGADVAPPESRGGHTKKLLASLQSLLQIISALSLFIGTFLVFNTMSVAVAQRRRDFGILRALGARQRDVVALVAAEAALLGLVASLIGATLGVVMARGLLVAVNAAIRATYVPALADQLVVDPPRLAALVAVGVAAAIVGALGPAVAAAAAPPGEAMTAPHHAAVARPLRLRLLAGAAAFAALAALGVVAQTRASDPTPGSAAALALMLAIALAAAPLLALALRALGPLHVTPTARLARDSVLRNPGRAAVTAAALSAALTMVVGMASFIESDRRAVFSWLDQSVSADLFVGAGPIGGNSTPIPLEPSLAERIRAIPGVRAVDLFRQVRIAYRDTPAALASVDVPTYLERGSPQFAPGTRAVDLRRLVGADEVFVSDNFARKHGIAQDDALELGTPDGPRRFVVAAIAIDYTSDQGLIFMDRTTYVRRFHDSAVDSFAVMLADPAALASVRAELERLESGALFIQTNAEFKAGIRKLVDDFFATTYAMEAVALLVGVLGIANTMLVAVLERRREIGVLRAVGATRRHVATTVLIEAGTIGAAGAVLGLVGGAVLAAITLVVGTATSGWVFPYVYEWRTAASVAGLAIAAALAAGWWPARSAARAQVADALAYE